MRKLFLIFLFLPIFILYACGVPSEANLGTPENDRKNLITKLEKSTN